MVKNVQIAIMAMLVTLLWVVFVVAWLYHRRNKDNGTR